jgi:DNA-binding MarR family transcriptional regulator
VAAICGATAGLARAGLLDGRRHTSAAAEYLAATGYPGGDHYVQERAVIDGDLITAGPQSPMQFARATLARLGLASDRTLDAYAPATENGQLFTDVIVTTFRLNALLRDVAQGLAIAGGLTAAWWQVLGGVLDQPRSIAEIGRRMGMTPQGVRRVADLLVERGLAEYRPTPVHRRVKLLACTEAGYWAIRRIAVVQHPWAARIGAELETDELRATLTGMQHLVSVLEHEGSPGLAR